MEKCKNINKCRIKHERWKKNQEKFVPIGQQEHDSFLNNYLNEQAEIKLSKHFKQRSYERSISKTDLEEILEFGWVIERNITKEQDVIITILGYTSQKRSLHIVFRVDSDNFWVAITGYSPKSHSRKWSDDFQERICFCEDNE